MREWILAVLLATAAVVVAWGIGVIWPPAGIIVLGLELAVWAWLFFGDVSDRPPTDETE